jgi:hypothetical protein
MARPQPTQRSGSSGRCRSTQSISGRARGHMRAGRKPKCVSTTRVSAHLQDSYSRDCFQAQGLTLPLRPITGLDPAREAVRREGGGLETSNEPGWFPYTRPSGAIRGNRRVNCCHSAHLGGEARLIATNTPGNILRKSSATCTRPSPSSCRPFLHDLQERMGEFQLAHTGDQSPRNNII